MTRQWQQFSSVGLNFGVTVAVCAYIGYRLDMHWDSSPWWTLGLTLFGIFAAMYHLIVSIRDINKK